MGIIASVAGLAGLIQANLTLNFILGLRNNFREFILVDCIKFDLKKILVNKSKDCKICNS